MNNQTSNSSNNSNNSNNSSFSSISSSSSSSNSSNPLTHPENDSQYKGLQVNSGVTSQPCVNPYRRAARARRRELSAAD